MSSVKNGKAPEEYIKDFEENKGHPLKTFMALFKGYYHNLILAGIFFLYKAQPGAGFSNSHSKYHKPYHRK